MSLHTRRLPAERYRIRQSGRFSKSPIAFRNPIQELETHILKDNSENIHIGSILAEISF